MSIQSFAKASLLLSNCLCTEPLDKPKGPCALESLAWSTFAESVLTTWEYTHQVDQKLACDESLDEYRPRPVSTASAVATWFVSHLVGVVQDSRASASMTAVHILLFYVLLE